MAAPGSDPAKQDSRRSGRYSLGMADDSPGRISVDRLRLLPLVALVLLVVAAMAIGLGNLEGSFTAGWVTMFFAAMAANGILIFLRRRREAARSRMP